MAVVQHCPSLELSQHRPRGRAQTWSQSLNLTVKYSFYFRTRKEKYGSDFERSPRLEKEPEGLNFSFMLWLPAYFPLFAFANTARTRTVWLADTPLSGSAGVGQLPDQLWENAEFEENRAKRHKSSLSYITVGLGFEMPFNSLPQPLLPQSSRSAHTHLLLMWGGSLAQDWLHPVVFLPQTVVNYLSYSHSPERNSRYLCRRDTKASLCFFIHQDSMERRVGCSCSVDEAATFIHRLCPTAVLERISVTMEEGMRADGFSGLPLLPQPHLCKHWEHSLL